MTYSSTEKVTVNREFSPKRYIDILGQKKTEGIFC